MSYENWQNGNVALQPDVDEVEKLKREQPEVVLSRAILVRGLLDSGIFGSGSVDLNWERDAQKWIRSDAETEFSFIDCVRTVFRDSKTQANFVKLVRKELARYLSDGVVRLENPKCSPRMRSK